MPTADPLVHENDTVAGKYRIGRTIGEGGMGVVVAARHLELDQMVAIKFLRPEIAQEGSSAERFRREARAAVKIRSEHVCRVQDVGTLDNGVPYLVMEYLEGCDLSDEAARRGRLPIEEAVDYVLQACEALAEAHAAGIVHRDLKPGNLFLEVRRDGTRGIKVLDFGVSKSILEGAGQLRLTKTSSLVGSPLYMSPEQLDAARDVDPRADIWALATILFELIAGRTPFYAETIPQLVHAVMSGTPPPFSELGVEVPRELEDALLKSLSKNRAERHQTIAELARAIVAFGPPHAIISVLRAERVLASTGAGSTDVPLGSAGAGPWRTPNPSTSSSDDAATSKTLDVSRPPSPATGTTPAPWGGTKEGEGQVLRRGVVMAITLATGGAVTLAIAVALFLRTPKEAPRLEAPHEAVAGAGSTAQADPVPPDTAAPLPVAPGPSVAASVVDVAPPAPSAASAAPSASAPARAEATVLLNARASAVTGAPLQPPTPGRARPANQRPGAPSSGAKSPTPGDGISDFGGRR